MPLRAKDEVMAVEYTQVGALTVSRIGFGCYAMSGVYGARDPGLWPPLIRAARDLGVTLFDTADRYGPAEEILGRAVATFRDSVVIASKVGVTASGRTDASRDHVFRSCEASLRRLGTDRIDLYQVHYDDPATPVAETLAALEELRAAGKIREYGVGHLPVARVREYLAAGRPASVLFELSAVARSSARELLPLIREHGVPGIAFSPTGRGLLTGAIRAGHVFGAGDLRALDPLMQRERFDSGLRIAAKMAAVGARTGGWTAAQVAIAWVLAQPGVAVALTGPSNAAHLEENARACDVQLAPADLAEIQGLLAEEDAFISEAGRVAAARIVGGPLAPAVEDVCRDLMYVLEMAVERGWATEEQAMPLVFALVGFLKGKPANDLTLEGIRRTIAELVGSVLTG
ncbi:MAG: aldo/keto reductase [Bacillota bacterium]|nr:aldo/keto reductase [Bacillota bacterium]